MRNSTFCIWIPSHLFLQLFLQFNVWEVKTRNFLPGDWNSLMRLLAKRSHRAVPSTDEKMFRSIDCSILFKALFLFSSIFLAIINLVAIVSILFIVKIAIAMQIRRSIVHSINAYNNQSNDRTCRFTQHSKKKKKYRKPVFAPLAFIPQRHCRARK